jgi:hypothetical protein
MREAEDLPPQGFVRAHRLSRSYIHAWHYCPQPTLDIVK